MQDVLLYGFIDGLVEGRQFFRGIRRFPRSQEGKNLLSEVLYSVLVASVTSGARLGLAQRLFG